MISPPPPAFLRTISEPDERQPCAPHSPATAASQVIIDLAGHSAFSLSGSPPAPILQAFGTGPMHAFVSSDECDLDRAVEENRDALIRSRRLNRRVGELYWDDLIFAFEPQLLLYADNSSIVTFAHCREAAEQLAASFLEKYRVPPLPSNGSFQLIKIEGKIETESVSLGENTLLSDEMLELQYGEGFTKWHHDFVQHLPKRSSGLSIFEGPPGTGKTSYLRHLIGAMKETHRFYYIQPSHMFMLAKPEFVPFWVGQRHRHRDRRFVVILEDAEEAIMRRGSDNSAHVSAILNLSDGLLGDFIRLQVICTMNCATAEVDRALLRPGRLLSHRVFGRLDHADAKRLAEQLGKVLPEADDYSLAEIFAGHGTEEAIRPRIGFAHQP